MSSEILSTVEEVYRGAIKYLGIYSGSVVSVSDPLKKHRVQINVPGLVDESNWAWPRTAGGGSPQRGGHIAPKVGAEVLVQFIGGDIDRPIYECGHWAGDEQSAMPVDVDELSVEDAPKIQSLELGALKITVDEREGNRALRFANKETGDFVTLDLESSALSIEMTSAILLKAVGLISLEAAQITINDRIVLADSKPI